MSEVALTALAELASSPWGEALAGAPMMTLAIIVINWQISQFRHDLRALGVGVLSLMASLNGRDDRNSDETTDMILRRVFDDG